MEILAEGLTGGICQGGFYDHGYRFGELEFLDGLRRICGLAGFLGTARRPVYLGRNYQGVHPDPTSTRHGVMCAGHLDRDCVNSLA